MTEERKQELRELLEEAMGSLVIRSRSRSITSSSVDVDTYRQYLQLLWTFYPPYSLWGPMSFELEEVNETAKSKLLGFIRDEFAPFIFEGKILSASRFIHWGDGLPLDKVLEQLLKIAIVQHTERAVLAFEKYIEGMHNGFYQYIAILKGITLKTEIQVREGIRLVPAPNRTSECPNYLPDSIVREFGMSSRQWSVLIIDVFRSPIYHRPVPTTIQEYSDLVNPIFWTEVSGGQGFPLKDYDFHKKFCQTLSLACDHRVEITHQWKFSAEIEFFYPYDEEGISFARSSPSSATEIGDDQIQKAKCLYDILETNSDIREKLRIPIDRWIQSKTPQNPIDKIIDLGIAFEALYVPDGGGDLTYKFSIRAARHLGKDKEDRKELLKKFGQIYGCRSDAVHSGELNPTVRFGEERIPVSEFIVKAQDLCRKSILKTIADRQLPDRDYWNSLILGGEDEQASN